MKQIFWKKDGYTLRLSRKEDVTSYYEDNFQETEADEVAELTGSKTQYTKEEVVSYFLRCIEATDRYDFMIVDPSGRIIGESVLNEIDEDARCANFRIAIFHPEDCSKGLGTWAIHNTIAFAFEELHLHRVELDVFSFNTRAIKAYQRVGFIQEGIRREAIPYQNGYADDILMSILEDEWKHKTS